MHLTEVSIGILNVFVNRELDDELDSWLVLWVGAFARQLAGSSLKRNNKACVREITNEIIIIK